MSIFKLIFSRRRRIKKNRYKISILISAIIASLLGVETVQAALINATGLVGQLDYVSSMINSPSGIINAQGLNYPTGSVLDPVDHRLFVADYKNNRVLAFRLDASNHLILPATAIFVLGANNFTTAGSGAVTQNTFGGTGWVVNLGYDSVNKRLFVADAAYSRVLGFSVPPGADSSINGENASFVLGQPDFTQSNWGCTRSVMDVPDDVVFDPINNRLFVSDFPNSRILIFNVPPGADSSINGEDADYVLGQTDFTSKAQTLTRNGLNRPSGVLYDQVNNRLLVSDDHNYRVLIFNVPPGVDITGENADYVLGQPDFVTTGYTTARNKFHSDDLLGYDPINYRLFVADTGNVRVLIFSVPPGTDITGEDAQNVIGQSDYTSKTTGVSQNKFKSVNGQDSFDPVNNILFVKDDLNNRLIEFSMIHITTSSLQTGTLGSPYSQTIGITAYQGTSQNFSLYSGSLPTGLSFDTSTGEISGIPTASGSFTFTIEVDDNFTTGPFFDRKTYTLEINSILPQTGRDLVGAINSMLGIL